MFHFNVPFQEYERQLKDLKNQAALKDPWLKQCWAIPGSYFCACSHRKLWRNLNTSMVHGLIPQSYLRTVKVGDLMVMIMRPNRRLGPIYAARVIRVYPTSSSTRDRIWCKSLLVGIQPT